MGVCPLGLLPRAVVKKNFLNDMPRQHALRTCVKFYARKKVIFGAPSSPPVTTHVEQPQESAIPEDNKGLGIEVWSFIQELYLLCIFNPAYDVHLHADCTPRKEWYFPK